MIPIAILKTDKDPIFLSGIFKGCDIKIGGQKAYEVIERKPRLFTFTPLRQRTYSRLPTAAIRNNRVWCGSKAYPIVKLLLKEAGVSFEKELRTFKTPRDVLEAFLSHT